MKKFALLCVAALTFGLYGCENDQTQTPEEVAPTVTLEKVSEETNAVSFKLKATDATKAAYMLLGDEEDAPTIEAIFEAGKAVELAEDGTAEVRVDGLEAETNYKIVAAVRNVAKSAGSNTLYVKTLAESEMVLEVEIVQVDHEKMNFRVNAANVERIAYLVLYASKSTPEASYVLLNGEEIPVDFKESVEVADLEFAKEYQLVVAAEGNGKTFMAEPVLFTTDDDPTNVVKHDYTRARGTKYSSSCYIMFSYEDANEADNFAYNDKTLCLDFYCDAEKDYLPAGTYEVKESTEPDCVSSYRYSTYGYDNGVQLSSGKVVVDIDEETKAYSFDIDLYLKDGRHLQATYNGDVDNLPVVDIVTVETTFNKASATTDDGGENFMLELKDDTGSVAKFNITNAFKAPYIVENSYTINSSTEEFSVKALAKTGEFDAATSTFTLAGEDGVHRFATGSLHVSINWADKVYSIAFYGTLDNGYEVEAKYSGAVDGVSLEQRDEIVEVVLDTASANSYEDNTNWYITFTKQSNGAETHRLVLDAFAPAMEYLPAGVYELGKSVDGCSLGATSTLLYVEGEGQYEAVEARATVQTNMETKEYTFDVSFKVVDGRTFKLSYVGKVTGMEIVEPEVVPVDVEWTSFVARHWYSDNWGLTVTDATGDYKLEFDMRVGDSSLTYIPTGTYTLGDSGMYIDNNYSKFNGGSKAFKAVMLNIVYNAASKDYNVDFEVVLTDGRTLLGDYSGVIEGTPEPEPEPEPEPGPTPLDVAWTKYSASYAYSDNWELRVTDASATNILVLDLYTGDSSLNYIPSGTYTVTGSDKYIGKNWSKFNSVNNVEDATLILVYNASNNSYDVDFEVLLADNTLLTGSYSGLITGTPKPEPEPEPEPEPDPTPDPGLVEWTTYTARHWYSDNWGLTITDATGANKLEFDLYVGDSSLTYIPSGTYTFGDSGMYLKQYYCKYNGVANLTAATVDVTYNESDKTYNITFDVTISDGATFTGSYTGAVAGTPKE